MLHGSSGSIVAKLYRYTRSLKAKTNRSLRESNPEKKVAAGFYPGLYLTNFHVAAERVTKRVKLGYFAKAASDSTPYFNKSKSVKKENRIEELYAARLSKK
ncbi:hypothetical protein OROHE_027432 [Orobanche hederae]